VRRALALILAATAIILLAVFGVSSSQVASSLHEESVTDCARCHTCEHPTADAPCLVPCPRLQAVHATGSHHEVEEGPDSLLLGTIANLYEPVHFNHKRHAGMAQMGKACGTCHHYSPAGRIQPCSDCHDAGGSEADLRRPSLKGAYHRQCLGCHREWTHDTQCIICHAPQPGKAMAEAIGDSSDIMGASHPIVTEPDTRVYQTPYNQGPVVTFHHKEHIELFGLRCVDCHQTESCSRCHDLQKSSQPAKTQEEIHATCNGCHSKDACAKCHDTKEKPGFVHTSTGWPLNRFHQGLDCRACHPTGKRIARLNNACGSCHGGWNQSNFKHAITGMQLDETHRELECENCHANREYSSAPHCDGCHDDGRTYKDVPPGEYIKQ
jgi:hypothetical protein